jgi:alanine racemase
MLRNFFPEYHPLNLITVSRSALVENYLMLTRINSKIKIAPVLKSNAYGHDLIRVAKTLDTLSPPFFCVDSLYEAYEIYKAKIKTPILIMGHVDPENLKVKKLPFLYVVSDIKLLEAIGKYQANSTVHIKVDTGMSRMGIPLKKLQNFLRDAVKIKNIKIDGVMSHLAETDDSSDLTNMQLENFQKALDIFDAFGIQTTWQHIASSGGLLNISDKKIEKLSNVARTGLAIYGIDPDGKYKKLKPALSLQSKIVQIKIIKKGSRVGYGGTYKAQNDVKLGILPIGYNDGVDRRLSNKGFVTVNNTLCPIIGMVSMNIAAIDLNGVKNAKVGQSAIVFSADPQQVNSVEKSAITCNTIPYELLVHLSPTSIKRYFI